VGVDHAGLGPGVVGWVQPARPYPPAHGEGVQLGGIKKGTFGVKQKKAPSKKYSKARWPIEVILAGGERGGVGWVGVAGWLQACWLDPSRTPLRTPIKKNLGNSALQKLCSMSPGHLQTLGNHEQHYVIGQKKHETLQSLVFRQAVAGGKTTIGCVHSMCGSQCHEAGSVSALRVRGHRPRDSYVRLQK